MIDAPPTVVYLHPMAKVLQRDLKALQVNHSIQVEGDHVKRLKQQAFVAERRADNINRFTVYRVSLGERLGKRIVATRIKRER